jgi:membrane associated rhomboid family serine protease
MEYSREDLPTATISLIVIITLLYGVQHIFRILFGEYSGFTQLQRQSPGTTSALYIQEISPILLLVLSPFLHGHLMHFAYNLLGLLFFGSAMEKVSETLYLLCLLTSSYLSSIFTFRLKLQVGNPFPHTIGISAGIFAVAAFAGIYYLSDMRGGLMEQKMYVLIIKLVVVAFGLGVTLASFKSFILGGEAQANQLGHAIGSLFGIVLFILEHIDNSRWL